MHDGAWTRTARTFARSCLVSNFAERAGRQALHRSCEDSTCTRARTALQTTAAHPQKTRLQSAPETLVEGRVVRTLRWPRCTAVLSDGWFLVGSRRYRDNRRLQGGPGESG